MNKYQATIRWHRQDEVFIDNKYSRKHSWHFDGGAEITASASPHIVPEPYSDPEGIDPEESFVASLSSCHMLWFLSLAAKEKIRIDRYEDQAEGIMQKNKEGKLAITKVILKPKVTFGQDENSSQEILDKLHQQAHQRCFIAHSVKTEITVEAEIAQL